MIFNQQPPTQGGGSTLYTVNGLYGTTTVIDWDTLSSTTSGQFPENQGVVLRMEPASLFSSITRDDDGTAVSFFQIANTTSSGKILVFKMPGSNVTVNFGGDTPKK